MHVKCEWIYQKEEEYFVTYGGIVNKGCENFKINELTPDAFKKLIFVQGLTVRKDAEIRVKIVTKIEQNSNVQKEE